jgi:hypothetical protein
LVKKLNLFSNVELMHLADKIVNYV